MEVYLVRHTTPVVHQGICYGQTDLEIDHNHFEEELKLIQSKLPDTFDFIFTSPLKRCKNLAEKFHLNPLEDKRLIELNFGDWENKKWNEIPQNELQPWMNDFVNVSTKSGESFKELHLRTCDFIDSILEESFSKIAIISHAGNIRSFMSYVLDLPLENAFRIQLKYGSVVHIKLEKEKNLCQLIGLN